MKVRLDGSCSRIYFQSSKKSIQQFSDISSFTQNYPTDENVTGVDATDNDKIKFYIDGKKFQKQVIQTSLKRPPDYQWNRNALFPENMHNILVEFSSPNIAKPFHIGHFRSTIIGNFVAKINAKVGNKVIKINYLGDWGTQFGLLLAGLKSSGIENIKNMNISDLLKVYIDANEKAKEDDKFAAEALENFNLLENGDIEKEAIWEICKSLTIEELNKNYDKLGISFDQYHGESEYSKNKSVEVLKLLEEKNLLKQSDDGRTIIPLDKTNVTVTKSDGTSLYISRDIAAALDRKKLYNFDKMYYVVDNSQGPHFHNLFEILRRMGCSWADDCHHVKFGKIQGMSTRQGNIVLMNDILEEAKMRMMENQDKSNNTKVTEDDREATAQYVGISALIINDLKQRRTKDYSFSWDLALNDVGDTGVKLQYTHARLSSLISKCSEHDIDVDHVDAELLSEPIAVELVYVISRYDEILSQSYKTLEPYHLVKYLFQLCNTTSKAIKLLPVKQANNHQVSAARLKMFEASRKVLADGLDTLGIKPLEKI